MTNDPKRSLEELFPLPAGVKLRTHKFGAKPCSPLFAISAGPDKDASSDSCPEFKIAWEDKQQGLKVCVRERDNGHLIAEVFCSDASLLNKAAVSVGLMGTVEDQLIRKTIHLTVPEENGCSGWADFGLLTDAAQKLGARLGVVVFLLV